MQFRVVGAVVVIASILGGCAGASNTLAVPNMGAGSTTPGKATLSIRFAIPLTKQRVASHSRRPRYISPATSLVSVAVGAATPLTIPIGPSAAGCTPITPTLSETTWNTGGFPQYQAVAESTDGTAWFAGNNVFSAEQVVGANTVMPPVNLSAASDYPISITGDPIDNSMWIGRVYGSNFIDHVYFNGSTWTYAPVTVAGASTVYVTSLAAGGDGNIYYSHEASASAGSEATTLGRLVAGAYDAEYPTSLLSNGVARVKEGTDGSIWFIETDGTLGNMKVTPSPSTAVEIPGSSAGGSLLFRPIGLAVSPADGSAYYVKFDGTTTSIGHVSASGTILPDVGLPSSLNNHAITALAIGADGAIWFADYGGTIGSVTLGGTYTAFPTPLGGASSTPDDIIAAKNNLLYIAERGSDYFATVAFSYTCTASITAPVGTIPISVKAFDASGNLLSQALNVNQTIAPDTANVLSFTLNGVVDHVVLTPANAIVGSGCSAPYTSNVSISANAVDKSGNYILGSGTPTDSLGNAVQIQLSTNDPSPVTSDTFSPSTLTIPSSTSSVFAVSTNSGSSFQVGGTFVGAPPASLPAIAPITMVPSGSRC